MPTYAIGDLQGCCSQFQSLLEIIAFDPSNDTVWLVGDLVNRGPKSLETLRFVQSLGPSVVSVLGNHDLHLLAAYCGVRKPSPGDTLDEIISAPDAKELIDWVRTRPLAHRASIAGTPFLLVHAGLVPQWSVAAAVTHARELESVLSSPSWKDFIGQMYGSQPDRWDDALTGSDRLRCIVNILTRLRFCRADGTMDFKANGGLESAPDGFYPWFDLRLGQDTEVIVTGHWSALGLRMGDHHISTDSGCVWGGSLTAVRLEDRAIFQQACPAFDRPER